MMKQHTEMQKFIKKIAIASIITSMLGALFILPCFYILPYQTGDLGRLGGIPFGPYDTIFKAPYFLFSENIGSFDSLQNVEILTIGDSFSQGGIFGYQNFMGYYLNQKISNFRVDGFNSIQTAAALIEKNKIPNCKVLIIESVERLLLNDLGKGKSFNDNIWSRIIISGIPSIIHKEDTIIRSSDLNFIKLTSYYKNKFKILQPYRKFDLSAPLFTAGEYSDKLFIYAKRLYYNDLQYTNISDQEIQNSQRTLNEIQTLGECHNIQIIFLVAADKYDMYYDFIVDNPYSQNPTFSYFSDFDTTFFANTKRILLPYIKNGEKDIYRVNDTHWSPKAAKIVGEYLGKIIKNRNQ